MAKLSGGLGNQLFQYSAARALAEASGAELWLDESFYDCQRDASVDKRHSLLGKLRIRGRFLPPECSARLNERFTASAHRKFWLRLAERSKLAGLPRTIIEHGSGDLGEVDVPPEGVFLVGCWQSYRNFHHLRATLREEFAPRARSPESVQAFERMIAEAPAVAVHIRRGDYLNERVRKVHGVLSLDYYRAALAQVRRHVPEAVAFLFTDDPGWAEDAFRGVQVEQKIVDYPESATEPYWDMALMRLCKAHVLANSTFGWWGAYLSERNEDCTFLPRAWLALPVNRGNALCLPGWTTVEHAHV